MVDQLLAARLAARNIDGIADMPGITFEELIVAFISDERITGPTLAEAAETLGRSMHKHHPSLMDVTMSPPERQREAARLAVERIARWQAIAIREQTTRMLLRQQVLGASSGKTLEHLHRLFADEL